MEKGQMRCRAQHLAPALGRRAFGVKTELKNINSFSSLGAGLAAEVGRQAELLESGGAVLQGPGIIPRPRASCTLAAGRNTPTTTAISPSPTCPRSSRAPSPSTS